MTTSVPSARASDPVRPGPAPPTTDSPDWWHQARDAGWLVVAAAIVVQVMTAPGQTVGVSVFVDHLIDDLDLTRSTVSSAYMVGTLVGAVCTMLAGRLLDRRGVRQGLVLFTLAFGLVLIGMSRATGIVTLMLGFAGIRAFGQGSLTLTAATAVAKGVADKRRGTAMGLLSGLGGACMALVPIVSSALIIWAGWRWTWVILGLSVWLVLLPLARTGLFAARQVPAAPTSIDTSTDLAASDAPAGGLTNGHSWSASEARQTWAFWMVAGLACLSGLIVTGMVFHHITLMEEQGLTESQAATIFLPQTLFGVAAAVVTGRLADRLSERLLLPATLLVQAGAPLLVFVVSPGLMAFIYAMAMGSAMTSVRAMEATVLPRWFGTVHIGEIRGTTMAGTVAGSSVGPLIMAVSDEQLGGYTPAVALFGALTLGLAVAAALTRRPVRAGGLPARTVAAAQH